MRARALAAAPVCCSGVGESEGDGKGGGEVTAGSEDESQQGSDSVNKGKRELSQPAQLCHSADSKDTSFLNSGRSLAQIGHLLHEHDPSICLLACMHSSLIRTCALYPCAGRLSSLNVSLDKSRKRISVSENGSDITTAGFIRVAHEWTVFIALDRHGG